MAEPAVAESDDDGGPDGPASDGEVVEDSEEDVEMVQTSVDESGVDPDGFFDDVEEQPDTSGSGDIFDGVDGDDSGGDESAEPAETRTSGLAQDINRGAARLSVVGLDDEWETDDGTRKKQDLQDEFEEVFEAFRLGHYGEIVTEEYLLAEAEDIHPVWGLCGAMLICAAVVMYRRPDGDQLVETGKMKLGDFDLDAIRRDD